MKGDDIISVIFLALIAIVIAGLVHKFLPDDSSLIVPSFVLISVGLWIAYDYILLNRYQKRAACAHAHQSKHTNTNAAQKQEREPEHKPTVSVDSGEPEKPLIEIKKPVSVDINYYRDDSDFRSLHKSMGSSGDNQLFNRMKYMSIQPKVSAALRTGWTARSLQPFVEEELREQERRHWWDDNEQLDWDL